MKHFASLLVAVLLVSAVSAALAASALQSAPPAEIADWLSDLYSVGFPEDPSGDPPDCPSESQSPVWCNPQWCRADVAWGGECWYCSLENMAHRYWAQLGHAFCWEDQAGYDPWINIATENGCPIPAGARVIVEVTADTRHAWEGWVEWPNGEQVDLWSCEKSGGLYVSYTGMICPADSDTLRIVPPAMRWQDHPTVSYTRLRSLRVWWENPIQWPGDYSHGGGW